MGKMMSRMLVSLKDEELVRRMARSLYKEKMFHDMILIADDGSKFPAHYSLVVQYIPTLTSVTCQGCLDSHQDLVISLPGVQPGDVDQALHQLYTSGCGGKLRDIIKGVDTSEQSEPDDLTKDKEDIKEDTEANHESVIDFTEAEHAYYESKNQITVGKNKDIEEILVKHNIMEDLITLNEEDQSTTMITQDDHDTINDKREINDAPQDFTENDEKLTTYVSRIEDNRRDLLICDLCEKDYESVEGLIKHRKKIHGQEESTNERRSKIECSYCGKMVAYIDVHIRNFHREECGVFVCDVCKKMVTKNWKKHRRECKVCPFCDYTNSVKKRLVKHIEDKHTGKRKTMHDLKHPTMILPPIQLSDISGTFHGKLT